MICASTVAIAAPFTPVFNTTTKNRSPTIFSATDIARMINGVTASPIARSVAAQASYKNVASSPAMMITIYPFATGTRCFGTFKKCKIGFKNSSPAIVNKMDIPVPITSDIAKDFFISAMFFAPNFCAVIIANPLDNPSKNPMIRPLSVLVAPTAASASSPRNEPTILVSTRL